MRFSFLSFRWVVGTHSISFVMLGWCLIFGTKKYHTFTARTYFYSYSFTFSCQNSTIFIPIHITPTHTHTHTPCMTEKNVRIFSGGNSTKHKVLGNISIEASSKSNNKSALLPNILIVYDWDTGSWRLWLLYYHFICNKQFFLSLSLALSHSCYALAAYIFR